MAFRGGGCCWWLLCCVFVSYDNAYACVNDFFSFLFLHILYGMARSLQMMVSVGYEYKRFRSICSNHVRHGKCLVMSRNLPAQARHKNWLKYRYCLRQTPESGPGQSQSRWITRRLKPGLCQIFFSSSV